jgi:hypothetical protein
MSFLVTAIYKSAPLLLAIEFKEQTDQQRSTYKKLQHLPKPFLQNVLKEH